MKPAIALWAGLLLLAASPFAARAAAENLALSQARALCFANNGARDAVFKAAAQAGWTDPEVGLEGTGGSDRLALAPGSPAHEFRRKMFGDHELTLSSRVLSRDTPNGTVVSNRCAILDEGVDGAPLLAAVRAYLRAPPSSVRGAYSYWVYKDRIDPANLIADDLAVQDDWIRSGGRIVTVFVSGMKDKAGVQYEERTLERK